MKIGPKLLIGVTLLCVVFYAGVFTGRISSRNTLYLPDIQQQIGAAEYSPLDLNTATLDELSTLPGIGVALATAIVEYRNEYGDYVDIDELLDIAGMTDALYDTLSDYVYVGG